MVIVINKMAQLDGGDYEYDYSGPYLEDTYSNQNCPELQFSTDDGVNTTRSWIDYQPSAYCLSYHLRDSAYYLSSTSRKGYTDYMSATRDQFWSVFYNDLYQNDKDRLTSVVDTLWKIKKAFNLDRISFANMVVSFVQDIPYSYILETEKCEDQGGLYFDCLTNENLGILSPVEFLYTLRGDCDTRTVLLYTLLKHFGYKPKVAVSWVYLHSMLLLDIPSAGKAIIYEGEPYCFWETTSTGWRSGEIPPDMDNIKNWKIMLH